MVNISPLRILFLRRVSARAMAAALRLINSMSNLYVVVIFDPFFIVHIYNNTKQNTSQAINNKNNNNNNNNTRQGRQRLMHARRLLQRIGSAGSIPGKGVTRVCVCVYTQFEPAWNF